MDKHRTAFRRDLEKREVFSARTVEGYVSAAGRLVRLCEEHGHDLYAGKVPDDLLAALTEGLPTASVRRVTRGAVLFLEFLHHERGIPVPLEGGEAALSRDQLRRFLDAAALELEPHATLLRLLPTTGLNAQALSRLVLDDVTQDEHGVALRLSTGDARLGDEAERVLLRFLRGWRAQNAPDSAVLFPSREGRQLSSSTITRRLKATQQRADLPDFRISALSELFGIYVHPRGAADAKGDAVSVDAAAAVDAEPDLEIERPARDERQPELPHMTPALGGLPPDDEDEDDGDRIGSHLRLVPPPPPMPGDDDEGEDDDEDDDLAIEPEPRTRASSSSPPTNHERSAPPQEEDGPMDHEDDDDFDEDETERRRPPSPPRRRGRPARERDRGRPSGSQPHPNLRKLLGQQGTVYIRRRTAQGRLADIGLFSLVDIGTDRSINTFIIHQLVPTYGPGDYEVYLHPTDVESYLTVPVAEPLAPSATVPLATRAEPATASSPMSELWELMRFLDERDRARAPSERQSIVEFFEQMKVKEELEALRRENARLAAGVGAPPGMGPAGVGPAGMAASLPALPPGPLAPSMSDQLAERYLQLLESQAAAAQNPSGPFDNLETLVELKRKLEDIGLEFGGGGSNNQRDFLDRMTEFLNSPFGQMVGKRMLESGGGAPPPAGRRAIRGGDLRDAARTKRERRAAPAAQPKLAPPPPRPRPAPPPPPDEEDELEPEGWSPTGVPDHFPSDGLAQAETAEQLLEALVFALMSLNFDPQWHDAVQALLETTVADDPDEALTIATSIAGALVHLGELERDRAELALRAMRQRWGDLRARVLSVAAQDTDR